MKIGLICFTSKNFYQFLFYSKKLILIPVAITALALSYHLYNGLCHLLTPFWSLSWRKLALIELSDLINNSSGIPPCLDSPLFSSFTSGNSLCARFDAAQSLSRSAPIETPDFHF